MKANLTEKQSKLLWKIHADVCCAKCNVETLLLNDDTNGLTKEQFIDSIFEVLNTARSNALDLCKTMEENP